MALEDVSLPPANRVVDDPDHTPDHNVIVTALQAILDLFASPITLESGAAGDVGLNLKLAPFASEDALRVTDSAGTIKFLVDEAGKVNVGAIYGGPTGAMLRVAIAESSSGALRIKEASGQLAAVIQVRDSADAILMEVDADGTVNARNIGTVPGSSPSVTYSPLLVLDAAEAVPSSTLAGTVVLRRPA